MTKEEKVEKLQKLRPRLAEAHNKLVRARNLHKVFETRWRALEDEYEKIDYELALNDERFKKVSAKDRPVKVELSITQIMEIAKELGIEVDLGDADKQIS